MAEHGSNDDHTDVGIPPGDVRPPTDSDADVAYQRLRAADPAPAGDVDLSAVRAAVDRELRSNAPEGISPGVRWLRVAAAVAGVAVIGAAGFIVGSRSQAGTSNVAESSTAVVGAVDSRTSASGGVAPAITLPGPGRAAGGQASSGPTSPLTGPAAQAASSRDSAYGFGGFGAHTVFRDGGLGTAGGSAEAWAYDPSHVANAETAVAMAAILGVRGSATSQYGGWTVGPADGSGPTVNLAGDGTASLYYYNQTLYNYLLCGAAGSSAAGAEQAPPPDSTVAVPDKGIVSSPSCDNTAIPAAVSSEKAIALSRDLLTRLGQNPDTLQLEASPADPGSGQASVLGYQVVSGQRTGVQWSFTFVGDQLANLNGQLAPLLSLGNYEVISPAAALTRLTDPRFGSSAMVYPVDYAAQALPVPTSDTSTTVPTAPASGAPIDWPVTTVTITGATLGLAMQYQPDGSVLLVPAYSLTNADGLAWSVIAISDSALNFGS